MKQYYILRKEVAFKKNIAILRKDIFKFYYANITDMTRIPQSTMSTYEAEGNAVTPGFRVAVKIADMYCMSLDRLCSYPIDFNIREAIAYMADFIKKIGYMDTDMYKKRIYDTIDETKNLTRYDVLKMVKDAYNQVIDGLFNKNVYRQIDDMIHYYDLSRFTYNYNHLMDITGTTYRRISDVCSIGMGTLTKLKKGGEPSLSVLIKLSDFFGVSMEDLYSKEPLYDEERVCRETPKGVIFSNKEDEIPYDDYQAVSKMKTELLDKDTAKFVAKEHLGWIEIPRRDDE